MWASQSGSKGGQELQLIESSCEFATVILTGEVYVRRQDRFSPIPISRVGHAVVRLKNGLSCRGQKVDKGD